MLHLQLQHSFSKEKTFHNIATFHTTSSEYIDIVPTSMLLMYRDGCVQWIYSNVVDCALLFVYFVIHGSASIQPSYNLFKFLVSAQNTVHIHKQYKLVPPMCTQPWFCIIVWVATCSLTMKMASSMVARAWLEIAEDAWPRHQLKIPNIVYHSISVLKVYIKC